jgi:cell fate (sporulation/competence/biofilm development) regulator YlbF (YheA/YmcA/DUF963 family)
MPVDSKEILDAAEKLGQLIAQHAAVTKYKDAQRTVAQDAEASHLLADFEKQLETFARQEQSGMRVTDAQRMQLETLQGKIMSHIKVKALNLAQVDFVDLLRKVSQMIHRPLAEVGTPAATTPAPALTDS